MSNETPTTPAGAEDDWPNTNGRVVDAAGNALPNSVAGEEPSPEEAAALTEEIIRNVGGLREWPASQKRILQNIIEPFFAPLRAELAAAKERIANQELSLLALSVPTWEAEEKAELLAELKRVKGDLTAQIEATRQVKASFDWMQQEHDKETDISCGLRVELAAAKEALQQATARIGELEGHHQRDEAMIVQRTFEVTEQNKAITAFCDDRNKWRDEANSLRSQLALANAKAEEARRAGVKCFDESHPDAIG